MFLLAAGGDDVTAAFYCFLVAIILLSACVVSFLFVTRTDFYRYHMGERTKDVDETTSLLPASQPEVISVTGVLLQLWKLNLSILLVYIVTLSCFPALTVLIESTEKDVSDANSWATTYFVPVACFVFFNVGDYLGRQFASLHLPHPGPSFTLFLSVLRIIFLPLFLFCNASPSSRVFTPVLFPYDSLYMLFMFLFSVSNGYLTTVCFVSAPQSVRPHLRLTAGNLMVSLLGLGLAIGSTLSAFVVQLL